MVRAKGYRLKSGVSFTNKDVGLSKGAADVALLEQATKDAMSLDEVKAKLQEMDVVLGRAYAAGQRAGIAKAESEIRNLPHEKAVIFDGKGNRLMEITQNSVNSVNFSDAQLEAMKGQTFTHNHPVQKNANATDRKVGNSLSDPDADIAAYLLAKEIRAVTPNTNYSLKLNDKQGTFSKASLQERRELVKTTRDKAADVASRKVKQAFADGKMTRDEVQAITNHLISKEYAKLSGVYTYRVTGTKEAMAELKRLESIYEQYE